MAKLVKQDHSLTGYGLLGYSPRPFVPSHSLANWINRPIHIVLPFDCDGDILCWTIALRATSKSSRSQPRWCLEPAGIIGGHSALVVVVHYGYGIQPLGWMEGQWWWWLWLANCPCFFPGFSLNVPLKLSRVDQGSSKKENPEILVERILWEKLLCKRPNHAWIQYLIKFLVSSSKNINFKNEKNWGKNFQKNSKNICFHFFPLDGVPKQCFDFCAEKNFVRKLFEMFSLKNLWEILLVSMKLDFFISRSTKNKNQFAKMFSE